MCEESVAWRAWQKRMSISDIARQIFCFNMISVAFGQKFSAFTVKMEDNALCLDIFFKDGRRLQATIAAGRDGLIGGTEFALALLPDGRRLAEDKSAQELYAGILNLGENLGVYVKNNKYSDPLNWIGC